MDYQTEEDHVRYKDQSFDDASIYGSCTLLALLCAKDGMAPEEDFEMLSPGLLVRPTSQCRVENQLRRVTHIVFPSALILMPL